jgi:hypothetical protein
MFSLGSARFGLYALVAVAFIAGPPACSNARAQSGWLEKGRELLSRGSSTGLSNDDIYAGLKEALRVGTENVVRQLGQPGGFNAEPAIHIPLPESLATVQSTLSKLGMSNLLDDLELRLNEAAEVATPKAKDLFFQAIREMTLEDARAIYNGPDDAATRYFQDRMTRPLAVEMSPVVEKSLAQVGAVQSYDRAMGKYEALPFVPDAKADLTSYVVEKGMDGIFYYLGQQEAAIPQDPAKRTTELLQKVFGAN